MIRTVSIFLAFLLLAFPASAQDAPRFFSSLPDVPLMEGMRELPELGSSFEKPEGRIVESVALVDSASPAEVRGFYAKALPELGWRAAGADSYVREGEELSLGFEAEKGQNFLKIQVRPRASGR